MMAAPKLVYLHGDLGDGMPAGPFTVYANSAREIASFFEANFGGFYNRIVDRLLIIIQGDQHTGASIGPDQVEWNIGPNEVHIMPDTTGGKGGGNNGIKLVLGAILIGVAIFASGGTLAGLGGAIFGNSLGITGTQVLMMGVGLLFAAFAQPPKKPENKKEANSSLYSGALNTAAPGNPVPLVLGRDVIVGGQIIHTALDVEQTTQNALNALTYFDHADYAGNNSSLPPDNVILRTD